MRVTGLLFVRNESKILPFWKLSNVLMIIIFHAAAIYYISKEVYCYLIGALTLEMICLVTCLRLCSVYLWILFYRKQRQILMLMKQLNLLYCWVVDTKTRMPKINIFFPVLTVIIPMWISITTTVMRQEDTTAQLQGFMFGWSFSPKSFYQNIVLCGFYAIDHFGTLLFSNSSGIMIAFLCQILNDIYLAIFQRIQTEFKEDILLKQQVDVLKMYRKAREIKMNLEIVVSQPLLFLLTQQFCQILLALTISYKIVMYWNFFFVLIGTLTYAVVSISCTALVVLSASSINISNRKLSREIKNVIEIISLETHDSAIIERISNILKFTVMPEEDALTVWELIPITRKLMLTMFAMVITYGMILMQFTN